MTVVVDTSILIDVLRGDSAAVALLYGLRESGPLHANEVVRMEVLAGMRAREETATRSLLDVFIAIAATAVVLNARLLTKNVKHFPMFDGLIAPY